MLWQFEDLIGHFFPSAIENDHFFNVMLDGLGAY